MSSHVSDRLSPFMDGELTAEERVQVEAHLRDCVECARELAGLVEIDALARELPSSAPEGYFESFPGRVRERLRARPARRAWQQPWAWGAAAALLLAVLTPLTLRDKQAAAPGAMQARDRVVETTTQPEAAVPRKEPDASTRREARSDWDEKLKVAKEQKSARPAAAPTLAPAPAAPPTPPATAQPPTSGFAAPPAGSGATPLPPAEEMRLRKSMASPTPWPGQQHGPRAQAQVPTSTEEAQGGVAQDAIKPKPGPEPGRAGASAEKRRDNRAELEDAKKLEEGFEKDDERKADSGVGVAAGRVQQGDAPPPAEADGEVALYRSLAARPASTASAARSLRERWRHFLRFYPQSALADQARVRIVEASLAAWRLGGDPADREAAQRDADAYLLRADALQKERVRALLNEIER